LITKIISAFHALTLPQDKYNETLTGGTMVPRICFPNTVSYDLIFLCCLAIVVKLPSSGRFPVFYDLLSFAGHYSLARLSPRFLIIYRPQ